MLLFFRQFPLAIFIQTEAQNCFRICTGKSPSFINSLFTSHVLLFWSFWLFGKLHQISFPKVSYYFKRDFFHTGSKKAKSLLNVTEKVDL